MDQEVTYKKEEKEEEEEEAQEKDIDRIDESANAILGTEENDEILPETDTDAGADAGAGQQAAVEVDIDINLNTTTLPVPDSNETGPSPDGEYVPPSNPDVDAAALQTQDTIVGTQDINTIKNNNTDDNPIIENESDHNDTMQTVTNVPDNGMENIEADTEKVTKEPLISHTMEEDDNEKQDDVDPNITTEEIAATLPKSDSGIETKENVEGEPETEKVDGVSGIEKATENISSEKAENEGNNIQSDQPINTEIGKDAWTPMEVDTVPVNSEITKGCSPEKMTMIKSDKSLPADPNEPVSNLNISPKLVPTETTIVKPQISNANAVVPSNTPTATIAIHTVAPAAVHAVKTENNVKVKAGVKRSNPDGSERLPATKRASTAKNTKGKQDAQSGHANSSIAATQQKSTQEKTKGVTTSDALSYLREVREKFKDRKHVYEKFLEVMKNFKAHKLDTQGVIAQVKDLFRGHRELITGFNQFLPAGYEIQMHQTVEFDQAIEYVNRIKKRFKNKEDTYKAFLEVLNTYRKGQKNISDVYSEVSRLFENERDLLNEFQMFLPEASQARLSNPQNSGIGTIPHIGQAKTSKKKGALANAQSGGKNQSDKKPRGKTGKGKSENNGMGNGHENFLEKDHMGDNVGPKDGKRHKGTNSSSDVLLFDEKKMKNSASIQKELVFFEKMKTRLRSKEAFQEFLKCLNIFNQEIISKMELQSLIYDLLGGYPGAMDGFMQVIGRCETMEIDVDGLNKGTKLSAAQQAKNRSYERREKYLMKPISELDFSDSSKCGASYRMLPADYPIQRCSGRTTLCNQVCNDYWVSIAQGSEDFHFGVKSGHKNQFEENLFRCEDDRFELDMILETTSSAIEALTKIEQDIEKMSDETRASHSLDDNELSPVQKRAIRRIYGDQGNTLLNLVMNFPHVAVKMVRDRLLEKRAEWNNVKKSMDPMWSDVMMKNYQKSLDHRSFYFKQQDKRNINAKMLINEMKEIADANSNMISIPGSNTSTFQNVLQSALITYPCSNQDGIERANGNKVRSSNIDAIDSTSTKIDTKSNSNVTFNMETNPDGNISSIHFRALSAFSKHTIIRPDLSYCYPDVDIFHDMYEIIHFAAQKSLPSRDSAKKVVRFWVDFVEQFFGIPLGSHTKNLKSHSKRAKITLSRIGDKMKKSEKFINTGKEKDQANKDTGTASVKDEEIDPNAMNTEKGDDNNETENAVVDGHEKEVDEEEDEDADAEEVQIQNQELNKDDNDYGDDEESENESDDDETDDDMKDFLRPFQVQREHPHMSNEGGPGRCHGIMQSSGHFAKASCEETNYRSEDELSAPNPNVFYCNDNFYVLFRLHQLLYDRLYTAKTNGNKDSKWKPAGGEEFDNDFDSDYDIENENDSQDKVVIGVENGVLRKDARKVDEKDDSVTMKEQDTQEPVRREVSEVEKAQDKVEKKHSFSARRSPYEKYLDLLFMMLVGGLDTQTYEDGCVKALGSVKGYLLFTMDKVVQRIVKHANNILQNDDIAVKLKQLYAYEQRRHYSLKLKNASSFGEDTEERGPVTMNENVYCANAHVILQDEQCYRISLQTIKSSNSSAAILHHFPDCHASQRFLDMQLIDASFLNKDELVCGVMDSRFEHYICQHLDPYNLADLKHVTFNVDKEKEPSYSRRESEPILSEDDDHDIFLRRSLKTSVFQENTDVQSPQTEDADCEKADCFIVNDLECTINSSTFRLGYIVGTEDLFWRRRRKSNTLPSNENFGKENVYNKWTTSFRDWQEKRVKEEINAHT